MLSFDSTEQSSEIKPISVRFLNKSTNAYRWQNHSILQRLLMHLFKVGSQNLYKETRLES